VVLLLFLLFRISPGPLLMPSIWSTFREGWRKFWTGWALRNTWSEDSLRQHLARQADLGSGMCRAMDESWEALGALLNQMVGPCWTEPTSCLCNNGYIN
jgi:hypothetical protein